MRINCLLTCNFLIVAFLTGCLTPAASVADSLESPNASPTLNPLLTVGNTPVSIPILGTPTTSATNTANLAPRGSPTFTPSLQVNLEAVGDIMLARTVGEQVQALNPEIVFAGVQTILASADVLVGNLECSLTTSREPQPKRYNFSAPPETAQALALAGFDVLSLANNHSMDYGSLGLFDTRNTLGQYGIVSVGAGANAIEAHTPIILERNGLRLAFLAYVDVPDEISGFDAHTWIATDSQPGIAWADPDQITADVTKAKAQADVVIVQLHSGYEVDTYLPTISFDQRVEAHAAIDAGAALVIGSHPHILQTIEQYHGGLIAYSLGNFVFDDYKGIANATIILRVILNPAGIQTYDWVQVLIENGLPRLAADGEAPAIGTMIAP